MVSGFFTSPRDHSNIFSGEANPMRMVSNAMFVPTSLLFVSGIYNVLADRGTDLRGFATDLHLPFGTPAEYAQAEQEANKAAFEMLM